MTGKGLLVLSEIKPSIASFKSGNTVFSFTEKEFTVIYAKPRKPEYMELSNDNKT